MTHIETLTAEAPKGRRRIRRLLGIPSDVCLHRDQVEQAQVLAQKKEWKFLKVWPRKRSAMATKFSGGKK